jgi:hypothetical protein
MSYSRKGVNPAAVDTVLVVVAIVDDGVVVLFIKVLLLLLLREVMRVARIDNDDRGRNRDVDSVGDVFLVVGRAEWIEV